MSSKGTSKVGGGSGASNSARIDVGAIVKIVRRIEMRSLHMGTHYTGSPADGSTLRWMGGGNCLFGLSCLSGEEERAGYSTNKTDEIDKTDQTDEINQSAAWLSLSVGQ